MHTGAREHSGPLLFPASAAGLGFGAWGIGGSAWGTPADETERLAAIECARERGIVWFDTAPTYGDGESERLLGRALRAHRARVRIATKVGPLDDPHHSLEQSLRRLGTDYVDLLQLHETAAGWESRLETLHRLQQAGKARAIGVCNLSHVELTRALRIAPIAAYQAAYNLFDRDVEERLVPLCREHGLAFLAYRPLASGLLAGGFSEPPRFAEGDHRARLYWFRGTEFERRRTVIGTLSELAAALGISLSALALRWLLSRPGATIVLAGARSAAHVADNLTALDAALDEATDRAIDAAVRSVFRLPAATAAAAQEARGWGPRERFIVEHLDGRATPEAIAAAWTDRGEQPMVAAQVKVFADQLLSSGLAV
ncbi:MAG TPA: aldo/keto reductase [Gemmatimonadales bacterium]|jgi:aryl-alcohol dehydrogenase-like predicted oxidoreductase